MRRSGKVLHISRGAKHSHGCCHASSTYSNGVAASYVKRAKDTVVAHFLDWSVVSLALIDTLNVLVFIYERSIVDDLPIISVIIASGYRIVVLRKANRIDPLCRWTYRH